MWKEEDSRLTKFMESATPSEYPWNYVSLFTGGGVGDAGMMRAGFKCIAAAEIDPLRARVYEANISPSRMYGDIRKDKHSLIEFVEGATDDLDLLTATPPCQSFSTANPKRGKQGKAEESRRDHRNSLFFDALEIINALKPKVAIIENVPNFFARNVYSPDGKLTGKVGEFLDAYLPDYHGYQAIECLSDYAIPQRRKRALAIYCRKDILTDTTEWLVGEHPVLPKNWKADIRPNGFRAMTAEEALSPFPPLDGKSKATAHDPNDPLHYVPTYDARRYAWIADIPSGSGLNAYQNEQCHACGHTRVPHFEPFCDRCDAPMTNRPHVEKDGKFRLVKGFKTSYRRMAPKELASPVTTSSSHFGSDIKLHPFQNRVLSVRECCQLQTVPFDFDWREAFKAKRSYAIRQIVGEAVPSWFAYKLGSAIGSLL